MVDEERFEMRVPAKEIKTFEKKEVSALVYLMYLGINIYFSIN